MKTWLLGVVLICLAACSPSQPAIIEVAPITIPAVSETPAPGKLQPEVMPVPEPWVMQRFEGKLERWVRGERKVKLTRTEGYSCGDINGYGCIRSVVVKQGMVTADGTFSVPLPDGPVEEVSAPNNFYCAVKEGQPLELVGQVALSYLNQFVIATDNRDTGQIIDTAYISNRGYVSPGEVGLELMYSDRDLLIQGFCLQRYKTNLNLKKGWNLTRRTIGKISDGGYDMQWFTPTRDSVKWYYNPLTLKLRIDAPAKKLRIGDLMSGVSLRFEDSDPVPDLPNISTSLVSPYSGWTFRNGALTAKALGAFRPEIEAVQDGITYSFFADSSDAIQFYGLQATAGKVLSGSADLAQTWVRFTEQDQFQKAISFAAGSTVKLRFPNGETLEQKTKIAGESPVLVFPKEPIAGTYFISLELRGS